MSTTVLLLLLALLLVVALTLRTVAHGGRGRPPRSHECDSRFLPPASLLH